MKPRSGTTAPARVHSPGRATGFTLIELMAVVAIVAILAIVATSAYSSSVRKTRRGAAQGCLVERAMFMERYYSTNFSYSTTPAGVAMADGQLPTCTNDVTKYYNIGNASAPSTYSAAGFTLQAIVIASSPQAKDTACSTMTINQIGAKTPAACW